MHAGRKNFGEFQLQSGFTDKANYSRLYPFPSRGEGSTGKIPIKKTTNRKNHSMILINKTYSIVTPESAENGEDSDSGFLSENEKVTFRELVNLMQGFPLPSCSQSSGEAWEWLTSYPETDFQTGEEETQSLHFSRQNGPWKEKYWKKAMQMAGIK
jgi:hypothetical protein